MLPSSPYKAWGKAAGEGGSVAACSYSGGSPGSVCLLQMQSLRPYVGPTELESASSLGDFMQIKIEEALVWKSDSLSSDSHIRIT